MLSRRDVVGGAAALAAAGPAVGVSDATTHPGRTEARPFHARTQDGIVLVGEVHGNEADPTILFVHGLGQSRLCWRSQTPLAERFRLVTYDMRGHGDSDRPARRTAYDADALWGDDLATVMSATGTSRALVVAWSMGGYVLGQYLRRHGSAAVAGVNLVDAVTTFDPRFRTAESARLGALLSSRDLATRTGAIVSFLKATFFRQPDARTLEPLLAASGMPPRELYEALVGLSSDGLDAAYAAAPPMLLTHGRRDGLVRQSIAERMVPVSPRSRISIYPETGHSPFIEEPSRFNAELTAYAHTVYAHTV